MSLPRYPKYKGSGVKWLGEVPSHWQVVRYKQVFRERDERSVDGSETLLSVSAYTGVSPRIEIIDEGEHLSRAESLVGYKVCHPNDLVMNIMLAWNRGLGVTRYYGIVSPAYSVFEVTNGAAPRYLDYMLRSDQATLYFKAFSSGVVDSRLRLYPDTFGSLFCALPQEPEQVAIADFLDRETAKIDALIAEQEKLLVLLAEKRQAAVSHAVTRGLNPNAPMKDSGIPWLGEVPVHWEILPIKRVTLSIEQGWSPQCESYPIESSEEWGVLKVGCVNGGVFTATENKKLPKDLEPIGAYTLKQGDLLVSRANTRELVGSAAVVPEDHRNLLLCDKLYRLRVHNTSCDPWFVSAFLGTSRARSQIEIEATGTSSSMLNIGQFVILELPIGLPPIEEQRRIVHFVADEAGRLDRLRREAERAIDLLRERRSTLIAAAVTGKIDVRSMTQGEKEPF